MLFLLEIGLVSLISLVCSFVAQWYWLKKFGSNLSGEFGGFITDLKENLINPQTKRAFSHMAKMGGDSKAIDNIKENIARDVIQNKYGRYLPFIEKGLGIDVNSYLEEYGASNILKAVQEIAPDLGIDLSKGLEGLSIGQKQSNYGKRRF